jgi:hypothetical protein
MWGMKFNDGKCKVMHIGSRNPHNTYTMEERRTDSMEERITDSYR